MFRSKRGQLSVLYAALFSVVGCWKPNPKDDPHNGKSEREATASFYVRRVDGEAVTPRTEGTVWRLASHKEIFVRACVVDRKANKEVRGHKFTVEFLENGQRQSDLVTDPDGCFMWTEMMPYNPLAQKPYYVEVVRRIHGQGVHVGFRDVRLGINPWAGERGIDRQLAVKFLRTGQVSASHKADSELRAEALSGRIGEKPKLWVSDLSTLITLADERDEALREARMLYDGRKVLRGQPERRGLVDEHGALLEVLLSMRPKIRVEGLDGNPEYIDLKSGQFKVWVQLIASNVSGDRNQSLLLTPNLIPGDGRIIDQRIKTSIRLGLSRRVTRGRLELAIKVVPEGLGIPVEPFEGLYVLGDIEHILGSSRPFLSPKVYEAKDKFSYDAYVAAAENFEELKKAQQAMDFDPFIYETATVMFVGIQPGETATKRTVEYKVQTCVRDTLTGRRVQNQRFQVFDEDGKEIFSRGQDGKAVPLSTNADGCLIWNSSMTHKYYKPEEFYFPKFTIVHPRAGWERAKVKELVVNPWDAMFRTFGFDRQEFTQDFIDSVKNRKKIPSRLFVPRFSYHAIRFRYEIDRFMELDVKKQILLNLRPEVLRYSGIIGGRKVTEALRDGIYLMKVAIQKDYLDPADKGNWLMPGKDRRGNPIVMVRRSRHSTPKHYVSVVKKLVRVNGGEINTPVEFTMQDLRLMRVRAQFLVQLEPIDEQALQIAKTVSAENRRKFEELEKSRLLTDEQRRARIVADRERLEENLVKIRKRLANLQHGLLDVDRLANLSNKELEEFDLNPELAKEVVEALRLNDFTVMDAAPFVDLDKLVDKDSGLDRRTFVGPIIFLSNAYGDDLRPTDNLDETRCIVSDCDELKAREVEGRTFRNNYDTSKYFGSVAHLANVHVDDMIKDYLGDRAEYKRVMPAIASVANFADLYNLNYVSLKNELAMRTDLNCLGPIEKCSRPASDVQLDVNKLLNAFNDPRGELAKFNSIRDAFIDSIIPRRDQAVLDLKRAVTIQDLKTVAVGGNVPKALGDRLCRMYASNIGKALSPGFGDYLRNQVYRTCLSSVIRGRDPNGPFSLDQKLRVVETGEYVYKGGKQMNLNVGANFSLNHNYSFGVSVGTGINFADFPFIGSTLVGLGASGWNKPFSLRIGMDTGASRSKSDGTSISESTYLVMQAANFAIQLKRYERCTVLKVDPRHLGGIALVDLAVYARNDEQKGRLYSALHRGLFVCTGEIENKPLPVRESFYYFTQHFTEGDMLDQADLYNHPWLLAMRGVRDFTTFFYLIRAQEFSLFQPFTKVVDKPGWPLDQMVEAYRQVIPTFPGLYTVLKDGEALQEYPFDQEPEESFR